MAKFTAHIEGRAESGHSNGPPEHRCHEHHGHSWRIEVEFSYFPDDLDIYGWGPDFGGVKQIIEDLDHKNLNKLMDPVPPSAENVAKLVYDRVAAKWEALQRRSAELTVRVHEGGGNVVTYK